MFILVCSFLCVFLFCQFTLFRRTFSCFQVLFFLHQRAGDFFCCFKCVGLPLPIYYFFFFCNRLLLTDIFSFYIFYFPPPACFVIEPFFFLPPLKYGGLQELFRLAYSECFCKHWFLVSPFVSPLNLELAVYFHACSLNNFFASIYVLLINSFFSC